jgi:hypothetical protein
MSKFSKRIKKLFDVHTSCLVIGQGFSHLEDILEVFETVFVVSEKKPEIKHKKLVYRENCDNLSDLYEIQAVFFDLDQLDKLIYMPVVWTKNRPIVIIEGNDPIERTHSKPLYDHGFRCVELLGFFHIWKKQK